MAKDFKGHLEAADPRNVLWGAGGCTWPTVPPYRLRLGSQSASGPWELLKTSGVLLEAAALWTHDDVTWIGVAPFPDDVTGMWIWRHYDKTAQEVWWLLFITHTGHHEDLQVIDIFEVGPGNVNVSMENLDWLYAPITSPGSPLTLWQVYFDETEPLEGWPPWT